MWTIGYGHTHTATRNMQKITVDKAIILLKIDIYITESFVNYHFKNLRQCQFDALVSLLFNIGFGNFYGTNTKRLIENDPEDKYIAGQWIEFRNAGGKYLRGLMRRRLDELSLYYSW